MAVKEFFSHTKKEKGRRIPTKMLEKHIKEVVEIATNRFSKNAFKHEDIDLQLAIPIFDLLKQIAQLHDLGKYSSYFQEYLLNGKKTKEKLHPLFGAIAIANKLMKENDNIAALIACYVIEYHHLDLQNFSEIRHICGNYTKIFKKKYDSLEKYIPQIAEEVDLLDLKIWLSLPDEKAYIKKFHVFYKQDTPKYIHYYFFINYIYSLLIEADKLSASDTPLYELKKMDYSAVENLPKIKNSTNELRTKVRKDIIDELGKIDTDKQRLFTLTAPTGVGKTLSALNFALYLRKKETTLQKGQIIYALPFINIIEQSFKEYKDVFVNSEVEVFAHYQYADVFGLKSKNKEGEELKYNQKVMSLDTWQSDIIITSFVQLLHTLIGNDKKLLLKFNHFADSILILDEVQTIRLDLIPVVGAALFYLTKFMNTRVLLMTATKPEIMNLAFRKHLSKEGFSKEECEPVELLPDYKELFGDYKRTQIEPLLDIDFTENTEGAFIEKVFSNPKYWQQDKSCLIVVNKVMRSLDLYNAVSEYLKKKNFSNPLYYLSTNIVPAHRYERIQKIKADIEAKKYPILIATQVVEAGVDLNFDMGFRDLAPIDSIVQVAGRINRDAIDPRNPTIKHKPLYIIDFKDCFRIYGSTTESQSRIALEDKKVILEGEYLELVSKYFEEKNDRGFDDSLTIFRAMQTLEYEVINEKFQVIQGMKNALSVFVELDEAKEAKEAFLQMREDSLPPEERKKLKEEFAEKFKTIFNQHIIAVPNYYVQGRLELLDKNDEDLKIWVAYPTEHYEIETGFIRNKSIYEQAKESHKSMECL
jgi:CRISPR-associated endonuclease/helicase Cas3